MSEPSPLRVYAVEDGSACGYYRLRLPFDTMKANGHDVRYEREGKDLDGWPIVVAQRFGYPGFQLAWLKLWRNHKMVWETDDDLWNVDPSNERAWRFFSLKPLMLAIEHCATTAHMITVSTEPLAEAMRQFNPNVHVLPNHVDGRIFDIDRKRNDRVTVGWAGGDSHKRDWQMVAAPLRRFLSRNPDVDFHTIGADYRADAKIAGRWSSWAMDLFDYYRGIDFDIGIAPLIPSAFNRSKSAIKALEYGALGIPVIASDLDPYRDYVLDGVTGFLVNRDHEWERRLRDLTYDHDMRAEMGAKAREHARGWSIDEGWRLWEQAYRTLEDA